ncbi:TetR/AcrR family transcriptional regulator [Polyangium aurulentum]|uniref:TetR/AcrR family transcriptional regulator n=1 Tax=Polyangium aurulentum TaxID=2567896 RepID=UPI0010AE15E1|nr:TetR/AcrR family transcriptional regulator [Polyangium aurulentum]UQA60763.1 TetR/AcrR family transcriptional regulator [Polyangium aurulentum]
MGRAAGTTKGEETRRTILGAGLALASEVGLAGVTIGTLAERTGMSKSGLFGHFSSKENLQVALLDEARQRFVDRVIAPALRERRGEPRVRALLDRWLDWGKQDDMPGGCIFVVAMVELDDQPGPARDLLIAVQKDWLEVLATAARIAVEERHFREDLDVRQLAYELYAVMLGHKAIHRLHVVPQAEKRLRAAFERLLDDARA